MFLTNQWKGLIRFRKKGKVKSDIYQTTNNVIKNGGGYV